MTSHVVPHQAVEARVRRAAPRGRGLKAAYLPVQLPVDVCVAVTTASRRIVYMYVFRVTRSWALRAMMTYEVHQLDRSPGSPTGRTPSTRAPPPAGVNAFTPVPGT